MKIKNRNKKGELTTKQIVTIIILVVSFVIILFFLFKLNLGSESEKDICHNSVVLRSNSIVSSSGAVPLDCKTSYVCITKKGRCDALVNPEVKRVKTEDGVYEALANELADCWWMYGEGQLNYVGKDLVKEMYCARCSQVVIDSSVKDIPGLEKGVVDGDKFYQYMQTHNISSRDSTYLEYLYGTNDYTLLTQSDLGEKISLAEINFGKQYTAITGMTSETNKWEWAAVGAGVVVLSALTGGIAGVAFASIAVATVGGGAAGYYALAPIAENIFGGQTIKPSYIKSGEDELSKLGCQNIVTKS